MDEIDCAAERIEAFNQVALRMVLNQLSGKPSSGICQSCGCVIEPLRLRANPMATHCRECADDVEHERRRSRLRGPR